ncbi:expressed unknown protein [Seminavis robusta]|uniref:Uncharacterized protein n=1 Tax=Seminavis robusta TaxID=568900 RepID=A0A9N8HF35_9STRA|nr:expressed unknown protein [Seminavis robusta]|eukprot:Sro414_g138240.1 n/a (243) ;mRNA; r:19168-19896
MYRKLFRCLFMLALQLFLANAFNHAAVQGGYLRTIGRTTLATAKTKHFPTTLGMANSKDGSGTPLDRVLSPKIDDPALPYSDVCVAQIIGPAMQVFYVTLTRSPNPTWLKPLFDDTLWQYKGALLAPTLVHGAGLACCWMLGALMARAYEEEAIDPTIGGYGTVLWRIFQAGCFASGVLILSTQVDLLVEFGRYVQLGESAEADARILAAWVDVINDIFFEILALVPIRLYLAASIAKNKMM